MKAQEHPILSNAEGKGIIGCLLSIVLLGAAIAATVQLGPVYYANMSMEEAVKTEASRAGARFMDDETIIREVYQLAKRYDIPLERKDIKVRRVAGQISIQVSYNVPVNFFLFERDFNFKIEASSFNAL